MVVLRFMILKHPPSAFTHRGSGRKSTIQKLMPETISNALNCVMWAVLIVTVLGIIGNLLPNAYAPQDSYQPSLFKDLETYYVYGLYAEPKEKFGSVFFYIGFTKNPQQRLAQHRNDNAYGSTHKAQYIRRVQEQGGVIEMEILATATSEKEIRKIEKREIKKYGLTNMKVG